MQGVFSAVFAVLVQLKLAAHVLLVDEGNIVAVFAFSACKADFVCHDVHLLSVKKFREKSSRRQSGRIFLYQNLLPTK